MAKAQRKYKDTVFRMLFGNNRRELLELYNAVKESDPQLELVVKIININAENKDQILEKCPTLRDYAEFVRTVRCFKKQEGSLKTAIQNAVNDCIRKNILADFLKKHKPEVIKVSIYEFDAKKYEGWVREEGREEGEHYLLISQVEKKVCRGKDFSTIVDELESDEEMIRPIYDAVLKYGTDLSPEEIWEKLGVVETA